MSRVRNVLSVAVLVALAATGGGAGAALSIGSKQIADDSIRSRDVRDGGLRLQDLHRTVVDELSRAQVVGFAGPIASIAGLTGLYVFAGPTARVTTSADFPRVTGTATAGLGLLQTGWQFSDLGLCSRAVGSTEVVNVVDDDYQTQRFTEDRDTYAVAASALLPAGSYDVGLCVRNNGGHNINNNGVVNGWVQVTA